MSGSSDTARDSAATASTLDAGAIEHESERGPRLAVVRIETARLARVIGGGGERVEGRLRVGARHLEPHRAGVGHADMGGGVVG